MGSPPTEPANKTRLIFIDALRGAGAFCAIFVHIKHLKHHTATETTLWPFDLGELLFLPLDFGYVGINLFLLVSGFCIHLGAAKKLAQGKFHSFSWSIFWKRRFHRLYPPYLVAIGYSIILGVMTELIVAGRPSFWPSHWLADLVSHLLMVHNLIPLFVFGMYNPALWSLGLEEQLYALYAGYLRMRRRWSVWLTLGVVLATTLVWILGMTSWELLDHPRKSPEVLRWLVWPFTFWFCWVLGAVAAEAYTGAITLPRWCYRLSTVVVFVTAGAALNRHTLGRAIDSGFVASVSGSSALVFALSLGTMLSEVLFTVGLFVLMNAGVRAESSGRLGGWIVRGLALVGIFTYSVYLTHLPLLHLLDALFPWDVSIGTVALHCIVYPPICLLVGFLFYWVVERRFLNAVVKESNHGNLLSRSKATTLPSHEGSSARVLPLTPAKANASSD
jgi:peptidoglycan/LPS O-acetylase OafA/YrhL